MQVVETWYTTIVLCALFTTLLQNTANVSTYIQVRAATWKLETINAGDLNINANDVIQINAPNKPERQTNKPLMKSATLKTTKENERLKGIKTNVKLSL